MSDSMTKKIIAIGGGENGREGYPYETKEIDEEIVRQTELTNPNFLFIGLASGKSEESYFNVMKNIYSKLNCNTDILRLSEIYNRKIIKDKIEKADIIYVGGGNTLRLGMLFRKYGIDELLKKAYRKGTVMSGISAGGICWCDFGNSDSRRFTSNSKQLIRVKGLGFIKILFCPHYNVEKDRQEDLKRMMKNTFRIPAIALENGVALEVIDDTYRLIQSIPNTHAYKCYWSRGEYIKKEIKISKTFKPINELYEK